MERSIVKSNQNLLEMDYVIELRNRLDALLNPKMKEDTDMFIRFLRARNYDVDAAEVMLRNHIRWRELYKADDILFWYTPKAFAKYIPYSFIGFDKEGCSVSFCPFGDVDLCGAVRSASLKDIKIFYIHLLETNIKRLEEQSLKLKKKVEKIVFILDLENYALKTATHRPSVEVISSIVSLFDENYPERLKLFVIYNASFYFQLGYALIKPIISGPTIQKIKIFGKTGWKEELLKHIDADVLPAFLGGNRTDPDGDPRCRTFINYAEVVPEKLYLTSQKKQFQNQPGVKKIIISRLSKKLIELNVTDPDSNIEWEFETKDRDIYFCLLFKGFNNSTEEVTEVVPKQRIDASIAPEAGVYKCEKTGVYFLEFDNSYSWIYQKEVYYKVQIAPSPTPNNSSECRSLI